MERGLGQRTLGPKVGGNRDWLGRRLGLKAGHGEDTKMRCWDGVWLRGIWDWLGRSLWGLDGGLG